MSTFDKTYAINVKERFPEFGYAKSFQRIQWILDDRETVDRLLTKLDEKIKARLDHHKPGDDSYTEAQALYDILRKCEDDGGFVRTEVKYVTGVLSAEKFRSMMSGPYAFLDPFVTQRHGAETHRIQWWMIAKDLKANPGEYDEGARTGRLFASTADGHAFRSGEDNVWYHTLDALQGRCTTARAPESLKEHINSAFQYVAAAEAAQMAWNTCVKWRYGALKTLSPVARSLEKNQELKKLEPD